MSIRTLSKKIKLAKIGKIKMAPRWADIRKYGMKRAKTRRVNVDKIKRWKKVRIRV
ncbi:MAG TPA: hypothetical protein VJH34_00055 [archaeon]|nr:hypothetical protein [archaeon]